MSLKKVKVNHFMFRRFGDRYLVTNAFGRYAVVDRQTLENLASGKVDLDTDTGKHLKDNGFIYSEEIQAELASMLKKNGLTCSGDRCCTS